MLKKLLLTSCTLLFLFEASSTSNVRKTEVVRTSEVFKPHFVKIFRRKYYQDMFHITITQHQQEESYFQETWNLTLDPKILKKIPKGKPQRKPSQAATCETCNKTIRTNTKQLSCIYCKNETYFM